MWKFLSVIAIGVALALPGSDPAAAQQKPKGKAQSGKCVSPRDKCFQNCTGRTCQAVCSTRPATC